jgi:peptidoglycan/LPS O-acetylase OafA/YrhL
MALFALSRTLSGRRLFWLLPASAGVVLAAGLDRGTFWPWVEFVFGSLVFYALWQKSQARPRQSAVAIVLLGAGVCAGGWFFMQTQAQQLLFSGLFALMLWAAFPYDEVISSWKGLRWLQQVGIISYSLYLIHIPIQGRFINMAMRATPFNSLRVMAVQIGGWAVAIAASALFYIVVEKPFHARGRIARIP